jgi:D-sedoheptulose 7-phosphate isomerase
VWKRKTEKKIFIRVSEMLNERSLHEVQVLVERYPALEGMRQNLISAIELIANCCANGGKLLVCGNGGSAADSLHIVGELMKSFVLKRELEPELQEKLRGQLGDGAEYYIQNLQGALPAISLVNEVSLMTAYGNDNTADLVFAQQVLGYGKCGDVLLAISTSGNSANVVHAAKVAKALGLKVVSMTGENGGELKGLSDVLLAAPSTVTYQIQEYHLPIYHALCLALEAEFFNA